jgi:competence protein ComGC
MTRGSERGFSLVALLLILVILCALYVGYRELRSVATVQQPPLAALDASRAFACKANRQTVERQIQMWLVDHPGETPSLAALAADGIRLPSCPLDGTYSLDGLTVRCSKHE